MNLRPDGDFLPDPNGYSLLIRTCERIVGEIPRNGWYEQATVAELAAWVEANREALRLADVALGNGSRVPLRFTKEDMPWSPGHPQDRFRLLARLLDATSRWAGLAGRPGEAAARSLDLVRFGHVASRGGLLLDRMTGEAFERLGMAGLGRIGEALDAGTCRAAAAALEDLDARREPIAETIARDRRWSVAVSGSADGPTLYDKVAGRIRSTPPFDKAAIFSAATQSLKCRRLAAELAARAYHLERGSPPVALDDLVPVYLTALPLDPSSGRPLRCRLEGDGRFSIELPG